MSLQQDNNPWELSERPHAHQSSVQPAFLPKQNVSDIDLKRLVFLWPWALASLIISLLMAWIYLRYAVPAYEANMRVSMANDVQSVSLAPTSLFDTRNPMNDKADLIKAPTTLRYVVDSLQLQFTAYKKGRFRNKDLFSKFEWRAYRKDSALSNLSFVITPGKNDSIFNWNGNGMRGQARWGVPFRIGRDSVIAYFFDQLKIGEEIHCVSKDPWKTAFELAGRIEVKIANNSNTADVTYRDELPLRARQVLHKLVDAYNDNTVEFRNKGLMQSIQFMNQRLAPLNGELDSIESSLASFKSSRGIVGVSAPGELYLNRTAGLDQQAAGIALQRQLLQAVESYVSNPDTKAENISVVGIADQYLQNLVSQYQTLRFERDKIARVATSDNPNRKYIEQQLETIRGTLIAQLGNYRTSIGLQENSITRQLGQAQGLLRNTPADEKQLLEKQRQQEIKQSLFLLLLQKREEAGIQLASTTADVRVLSPARTSSPISPKPLQVYGLAVLLGLMIPIVFGLAKEVLNNTITSRRQLDQMVTVPVLGNIDQAVDATDTFSIIGKGDRSAAAEQVRALRASLRFYFRAGKPSYMLVTSSFSGEGKTFLSANLATSYAIQGLRVALLEFDMRRPKLARRMGMTKVPKGLSTFLLNECSAAEIAVPYTPVPNLHLYPTGPVPPNPSELLTTPAMERLKAHLDRNYDVIIIDTPPNAVVADAQLLSHWADITLVVVRFGLTPKVQAEELERWHRQGVLGKMGIVFNGVKTTGYYGYYYYSYRQKYGYGRYYGENISKD